MPARSGAGEPAGRARPALNAAAVAERPVAANGASGETATGGQTAVGVEMDGALRAQRDAPVGGQAVLEGVMMRGVRNWAVAVRKPTPAQAEQDDRTPQDAPDGEIEVTSYPLDSAASRHRALRLPIIRGVVALGGSLAIGFRALEISDNAQLSPAVAPALENGADSRAAGAGESEEIPRAVWAGTVVLAIVLAVALFFLLPVGLTSLIKKQLGSSWLFWLVEGTLRTGIFLAYLLALSRVRDLRRVFEYHGAEHKTISCYEGGLPLTPANCQRFSRLHPRCGTSFLLLVMVVAIFVFAPIGLPAWYWLVLTRILGVPLIAGLSFELIKLAGRNRSRGWVRALMWPGLKLQLLTTREPDESQLQVAIAALESVLALETPGELSAEDLVGVEVVA
ncbi:MAG TPA: DUF1385 domain-containing protein [Solirubrobacteraceae bacterium]|nr:DUF1385 domain-containing protein [Solirubrobacteraceae bacterium]